MIAVTLANLSALWRFPCSNNYTLSKFVTNFSIRPDVPDPITA